MSFLKTIFQKKKNLHKSRLSAKADLRIEEFFSQSDHTFAQIANFFSSTQCLQQNLVADWQSQGLLIVVLRLARDPQVPVD